MKKKEKISNIIAVKKRDVNFVLFILIIVTLLAFVGFSTYYQKTYKNVSTQYKEKISELGNVTRTLNVTQEELSKTSVSLTEKIKEEEDLSKEYATLNDLKDQLEKSLKETRNQLTETINELDSTKSELSSTKIQLDTANAKIDNLNSKISSLKDTISNRDSTISSLNSCISDNGITC